jgi:hypothetical protein
MNELSINENLLLEVEIGHRVVTLFDGTEQLWT